MVSTAVDLVRRDFTLADAIATIDTTVGPHKVVVGLAPGSGLYLNRPYFDDYNKFKIAKAVSVFLVYVRGRGAL